MLAIQKSQKPKTNLKIEHIDCEKIMYVCKKCRKVVYILYVVEDRVIKSEINPCIHVPLKPFK